MAIRPRPHHPGIRQEWVIECIGEPDAEDLQPFFDALRARVMAAGGNI